MRRQRMLGVAHATVELRHRKERVHREEDAPQRAGIRADRARVERVERVLEEVDVVRRDVDLVVLKLVHDGFRHRHDVRVQRQVHRADRLAVGRGQVALGVVADGDDLVQHPLKMLPTHPVQVTSSIHRVLDSSPFPRLRRRPHTQ